MKLGDRVKTTWKYSKDLSTLEPFCGVIVVSNGSNVVVCSENRGRVTIAKSWLELDEPCCKCCKCCRVEPVEVYEYQILSIRSDGTYFLSATKYTTVADYLDFMGTSIRHTGHELFLPSKKLCK